VKKYIENIVSEWVFGELILILGLKGLAKTVLVELSPENVFSVDRFYQEFLKTLIDGKFDYSKHDIKNLLNSLKIKLIEYVIHIKEMPLPEKNESLVTYLEKNKSYITYLYSQLKKLIADERFPYEGFRDEVEDVCKEVETYRHGTIYIPRPTGASNWWRGATSFRRRDINNAIGKRNKNFETLHKYLFNLLPEEIKVSHPQLKS